MIKRGKFTKAEYEEHLLNLTKSSEEFITFLKTASNLHKYPFEEQLAIYMQNPNAKATAKYETWNKVGRYVKRGSKGIAVIDRDTKTWKHVFDISDTAELLDKSKFQIWSMKSEQLSPILDYFESELEITSDKSQTVHNRLEQIVKQTINLTFDDDFYLFMETDFKNSHFSELDDLNRETLLKSTLINACLYSVSNRMGLENEVFVSEEDFKNLWNFNDKQSVNFLCSSIQKYSNHILKEVEREIFAIEKNKSQNMVANVDDNLYNDFNTLKRENETQLKEDNQYDRTEQRSELSQRGRLSDTRSGLGTGHEGYREIWTATSAISYENETVSSKDDGNVRRIDTDTFRAEPTGFGDGRTIDIGESETKSTTKQRSESDSVGKPHDNTSQRSRRNRPRTDDLQQISLFDTQEQQIENILKAEDEKSSAFSFENENNQYDISFKENNAGFSVENLLEKGGNPDSYKQVAFINDDRSVLFFDKNLSEELKTKIKDFAELTDSPVFKIPPQTPEVKLEAVKNYKEPFVVISSSESRRFFDDEKLSFAEADKKFRAVEYIERLERSADGYEGGYKKTGGKIYYLDEPTDKELSSYEFRYDICDYSPSESGLFNHINNFWSYAEKKLKESPNASLYSKEDIENSKAIIQKLEPYRFDTKNEVLPSMEVKQIAEQFADVEMSYQRNCFAFENDIISLEIPQEERRNYRIESLNRNTVLVEDVSSLKTFELNRRDFNYLLYQEKANEQLLVENGKILTEANMMSEKYQLENGRIFKLEHDNQVKDFTIVAFREYGQGFLISLKDESNHYKRLTVYPKWSDCDRELDKSLANSRYRKLDIVRLTETQKKSDTKFCFGLQTEINLLTPKGNETFTVKQMKERTVVLEMNKDKSLHEFEYQALDYLLDSPKNNENMKIHETNIINDEKVKSLFLSEYNLNRRDLVFIKDDNGYNSAFVIMGFAEIDKYGDVILMNQNDFEIKTLPLDEFEIELKKEPYHNRYLPLQEQAKRQASVIADSLLERAEQVKQEELFWENEIFDVDNYAEIAELQHEEYLFSLATDEELDEYLGIEREEVDGDVPVEYHEDEPTEEIYIQTNSSKTKQKLDISALSEKVIENANKQKLPPLIYLSQYLKDSLSNEDYSALQDKIQETVQHRKEIPLSQENILQNTELDTEEGYSFIDGVRNNIKKDSEFVKREEQNKSDSERELIEAKQVADNYTITDNNLGVGGQKTKFTFNYEAIALLKMLEAENRIANKEEQEILSRYVGWGGLPQAFDDTNENWKKEYSALKDILSEQEYKEARTSTLNAHYTSPIVIKAMYDALDNMGFQKGNILEPAMGVGNFFGLLPNKMKESKLYGVEIDGITASIAKQLYPNSNIQNKGFEHTRFDDNFFDVAIGNVPFGSYSVSDKDYNHKNFKIHDYFIAKSLDKLRPDGVMAFITTNGTLDKKDSSFREYLSEKADLLGAIRLPNTAFKANANTEVTTDILFLKKRTIPNTLIPDWVHLGKTENGVPVNQYFEKNPHMMLGEMRFDKSMYGDEFDTSCFLKENTDLETELKKAVQNIKGSFTLEQPVDIVEIEEKANAIPADLSVPNYSYALIDEKLYFRVNSEMTPVEKGEAHTQRIKGLIAIRDVTKDLLSAQLYNASDLDIAELQDKLNHLYDTYTKEFGVIGNRANRLAFREDSSYPLLCSLENLDDDLNLKSKSAIFTTRTIMPYTPVTAVDTPIEALTLSISEKLKVDIDYMLSLLSNKMTADELTESLQGLIFKEPIYAEGFHKTGWVHADEYLTGDVRAKLRTAKELAETHPKLMINVKALENVQPKWLGASEISAKIGASWIEPRFYSQFLNELLGVPEYMQERQNVQYSNATNKWHIDGVYLDVLKDKVFKEFGTKRISVYNILEQTLNQKDIKIFDTKINADGKEEKIFNKEETDIAVDRQEKVIRQFKKWLWQEPSRRMYHEERYNNEFNNIRNREYDGSHLAFAGINPLINLRPHQKNAVARHLYGGNNLLAHVVGAGKTYAMIAQAMESKRLGLSNKALFVVPNHLTEQWGGDFMELYPNAKILVATPADFEKQNRKKFCSRIATGDYDAVIIGHTQFERIPLSIDREIREIENEVRKIALALMMLKQEKGERYQIKQLELTKKKLETKITNLALAKVKDDAVTFEELGIDRLFVDEAHYYKNLFTYSKMRNVSGINTSSAQKSTDLLLKINYMNEKTDYKGVTFATGTPVSNSMTELYTMQRYLMPQRLEATGTEFFDNWASNFGETVTSYELKPEGKGFQSKRRFAKFENLPELMNQFKEIADIITNDMLDLNLPKANYHTVELPMSEYQEILLETIADRADKVRARDVLPNVDNMLKITSDGRKLALDERLMNPLLPENPNSKANACVENVFKIYQETMTEKSTQLIFSDLSTPPSSKSKKKKAKLEHEDTEENNTEANPFEEEASEESFCIYYEIRDKLIAKGVKPEEIAFIHEADTVKKKAQLFSKVRQGKVRVLLGSTAKMGAGTNVQKRLKALHHIDVPWKPSDIEQREGRIIRQGNLNSVVDIFKYVTKGTFDSYSWQILENKQKFIGQIMTSKSPSRSCEDIDATALEYAEIKALATGDPRFKEKMDLDVQVAKLKVLEQDFLSVKFDLENKIIKDYPMQIKQTEAKIKGFETIMDTLKNYPQDNTAENFSIKLSDKTITNKEAAGTKIIELCSLPKDKLIDFVPIGEFKGFALRLGFDVTDHTFKLKLKNDITLSCNMSNSQTGIFTRIDNLIGSIPEQYSRAKQILTATQENLENAKMRVNDFFPHEDELKTKEQQLSKLTKELDKEAKERSENRKEKADSDKNSVIASLKSKKQNDIYIPSGLLGTKNKNSQER